MLRTYNVDSLNAKLAFLRTLPTIGKWESAAQVHLSYYMVGMFVASVPWHTHGRVYLCTGAHNHGISPPIAGRA